MDDEYFSVASHSLGSELVGQVVVADLIEDCKALFEFAHLTVEFGVQQPVFRESCLQPSGVATEEFPVCTRYRACEAFGLLLQCAFTPAFSPSAVLAFKAGKAA